MYRVEYIVNYLNDLMKSLYIPEQHLSIDESMMLWRGRLVFRQYIKNKKHRYGIKFFELCEDGGILLRTSIYCGTAYPDPLDLGQTSAVVLHLMDGLLDKNYKLYTDNYYNSVKLSEELAKRKTGMCGTLRSNRKHIPKRVSEAKLKKGSCVFQSTNHTTVCKWKDKRDVLSISNMHQCTMEEVQNRLGQSKMKPNIIADYNAHMSGIDRNDQMLSYHSSLRKSTRW